MNRHLVHKQRLARRGLGWGSHAAGGSSFLLGSVSGHQVERHLGTRVPLRMAVAFEDTTFSGREREMELEKRNELTLEKLLDSVSLSILFDH